MKFILVVEDDYEAVDAVIAHLRIIGHHIVHVDQPEEALDNLKYNHYDILLLDVMLPTRNCFTLEETGDG